MAGTEQSVPKIKKSKKAENDEIEADEVAQPNDRQLNLAAYCKAHSNVALTTVGTAFPHWTETRQSLQGERSPHALSDDEAASEVAELISRGILPNHRLDCAGSGKVVAVERGAWVRIRGDALSTGREIEREMLLGLHRVNVVLAHMEVPRLCGGGW